MTVVALLIGLLAAGCGGDDGESEGAVPDVFGQELFEQRLIGTRGGCTSCHSLEPDTVLVGPSLAGVASRAVDRIPGMSAGEYLRQSLINPDVYIVEGFSGGQMPGDWDLTAEQIDSLVDYLLTLR
jgi:hypothetical protein